MLLLISQRHGQYPFGEDAEKTRRTLRLVFSLACERAFPTRRCGRRRSWHAHCVHRPLEGR